jgi:hypothetical protein
MFLDQISFGTARIEVQDAEGISSGTGFFHHFCQSTEGNIPVIITNRHVVWGGTKARVFLHTCNTEDAKVPIYGNHMGITIDNMQSSVVYHPQDSIDLAIIFLRPILDAVRGMGRIPFYRCTQQSFIARSELIEELSFVEPVLMVGYPNGLWDTANNTPLIRQGITATPVKNDFNGTPHFVIDCACFPGSSGSPIYLNNTFIYHSKKDNSINMGASRYALLGILYAGPQHTATGDIIVETIPTKSIPKPRTLIPNNLGYCLHARLLDEFEPIIQSRLSVIP